MAIITTRAAKGMALTHNEVDDNFLNINASLASYDSAFSIAANVLTFLDTIKFQDPAAPTKIGQFSFAGITAGTTAIYTFPNVTGALATLGNLAQTFAGTVAFGSTLSATSTITLGGATTSVTSLGTTATTGTMNLGGTAQTGAITLGQSTVTQTVDIAKGATTAVSTKTVNIGTAGISGSTTNINYGSSVTGAVVTHTWNAGANVLRFNSNGNLGIGTTSPQYELDNFGVSRLGSAVTPAAPSATDILPTAHTIMSGSGGNYLTFGQYSDFTQWIQSSFINPTTATYDLALNPLGGNVGIGTGTPAYKLDVLGNAAFGASIITGSGVTTNASAIEVGGNRGDVGNAYVDLHSTVSSDYESRFIRLSGANGLTQLLHKGTGDFQINAENAAPTTFLTNNIERVRIDAAGNTLVSTGAVVVYAPAPAAISTTATLTNANIQAQIINTTGTTYTVTMPLGTTLETLVVWPAVNLGYNFTVINTASGTITMAANTGVTTLGALTIATGTSANFRLRRTAANTFVMYRVS